MQGQKKCRILKEIRKRIADENGIPYEISECTYEGDCPGTCPKCESELRWLEDQLQKKKELGEHVIMTTPDTDHSNLPDEVHNVKKLQPLYAISFSLGLDIEKPNGMDKGTYPGAVEPDRVGSGINKEKSRRGAIVLLFTCSIIGLILKMFVK